MAGSGGLSCTECDETLFGGDLVKQGSTGNLAASIHQRLLNLSRQRRLDFNLVLTRYAIERLLYRLSCSRFQSQFVLKGAMLFVLWEMPLSRPTRDLDLLGFGTNSAQALQQRFAEICQTVVVDDGLLFVSDTIRISEIREDEEYIGQRIELLARLGSARIPLQIDIGFGDAVYPVPKESIFPVLLPFPAPQLRAYAPETVIAEKLHAMVEKGINNSRMKDFYDIWVLSQQFDFDGSTLAQAIEATFARRQRPIPVETPIALTLAFAQHPDKLAQWNAFLRRTQIATDGATLSTIVLILADFLSPVLVALAGKRAFEQFWSAGGTWR